MHRFLRAVGFSNITTKQDMDKLLGITMDKPSVSKQILSKDGRKITELSREFAHNTGLTVRGEYDKLGFFHVDHYFPYCYSSLITMRTEVTINRRVDTSAFTGMCDDIRMAVSVIFYLQNSVDYIKLNFTDNTPHRANLALSGLSLTGRILLGIEKTDDSIERLRHETRYHNKPEGFIKDSKRWVIFPKLSFINHQKIEARNKELSDVFSSYEKNKLIPACDKYADSKKGPVHLYRKSV